MKNLAKRTKNLTNLITQDKENIMRTIEVSSTSLDKAIDKGLMLLEAQKEDVEIKVLEENATLKKFKIEMTTFDSVEERNEYLSQNPKKEVKEEVKKELPYDPELNEKVIEEARRFMDGLLKAFGNEYKLLVMEENKDVVVRVSGENMGGLIGYHGDALDAIQYILNTIIRDKFKGYERKVYVDIENYRAKRENTIVDMALRLADKVVKNRRSIKLEPMNRYERKIIHSALQNKNHIGTHSEGTDPTRYLVIDYIQ